MAESQDKEVREFRLEGAGLFIIVAFLGAGLVGAFFLGRWYERSSAPQAGLDRLGSDPLENVVPPADVEDLDATATVFDTIEGTTQAESSRQTAAPVEQQPAPPAATQTADPGGSFYVQIGAYRDRGSADKIVVELESAGYPVKLFSEDGSSGQLFKVRVGGYPTSDKSAAVAAELKTKGHAGAFPTEVP